MQQATSPWVPGSDPATLCLTTEATPPLAEALAAALVERGLAACVALTPLRSVYRWQGELQRSEEVQLLIKTHPSRLQELEATVRQLHSYDTPECGRLGSLCAGQVVTQLGPRPQADLRQLAAGLQHAVSQAP